MGSKPVDTPDNSRRNFLKLAGVSAPASVVAMSAGTKMAEAAPDKVTSGVQDTEHTRAYYDSARF